MCPARHRQQIGQISLSCTYGAERYRLQSVMINILGGGVQRDIFSKLARYIFPILIAQIDIFDGMLRLRF